MLYLKDAVEFSCQANRVSVELFPGLEVALLTSYKGLPAVEKV